MPHGVRLRATLLLLLYAILSFFATPHMVFKKYKINILCFCVVLFLPHYALCTAIQNLSKNVNVVSDGSPSRIRMVRRISLGMTTRPRSSILRTIPVAFIYTFLLNSQIVILLFVNGGDLYCIDLLFRVGMI